ncbi:hypothetical protein B0H12DRAFT_1078570 [Mycena haematopus]|nr:hypothetical protein B0H12DRAFT_1078570 [Mycena haematopus]
MSIKIDGYGLVTGPSPVPSKPVGAHHQRNAEQDILFVFPVLLVNAPPSMHFEALGEDILLSILCFCDVYTVLSVSAVFTHAIEIQSPQSLTANIQINKSLRRITLAKQLWLSLVQDSTFRAALELPPPEQGQLENYSAGELIDLVKSTVIARGPLPPLSRCSTATDYEIPLDDIGNRPDARLLPGARYILLYSITRDEFYIYDVWRARRVWQRAAPAHTMCQIDLVPGDAIARVLVAQPMDHSDQQHDSKVHVEEVDLTTGISSEVFDLDFVISGFGTAYAIVGDFFLCSMLLSLVYDASIILVNWRASTFVSLSRNGRNSAVFTLTFPIAADLIYTQFELIPGYVVTTYRERLPSHEEQILAVTALDAFSNYWQPLTEASLTAQLARPAPTTPITVTKIVAYNNRPLGRYVELTLTPNALYRGAYNVDVQAGVSESSTLMGKIGHLITAGRWATPTAHTSAVPRTGMRIAAHIRTLCS